MKLPAKLSPLIVDLGTYKPSYLSADLIAGLSVAAVQVPTAVAYAQLAGFSPEIGLYASILPVIVYALLGSSRQLVVGPDAATCTMVAALVTPLAASDKSLYLTLTAALSLAAGMLMVIGGVARMGFIVNFFSRPILVGFLNGIAASIIAGQLGKLLGIPLTSRDFVPSLVELFSHLGGIHWQTLAVGSATITVLALFKFFAPRAPSALIALIAASLGLHFLTGASSGVALVGTVPAGLPHIGLPQVEYHAGQGLLVGALGLVIVSFTSGMLTARSMAARAGQTLNPNQEMWAIGAANLAAGLSGSFAITGADSRTAVNFTSGNKTQLSSIFAALATAAVAAWLSVPLAYLPVAALAAVLIFSAAQLMDFSTYKELLKIDPFEFRLSLLTTAGVLTLGVLPGVAAAILFALIAILIKIYKPEDTVLARIPGLDGFNDISLHDEAATVPGMVIWRFEGPLVFFNADYFKARAHEIIDSAESDTNWFVLSLESISQIDATGVKAVEDLCRELDAKNVSVALARPKTFMRKLRTGTTLGDFLSSNRVFPTIVSAVEAIRESQVDDAERSLLQGSFQTFYEGKHSADEVDQTSDEKV